MTYFKAIPKGKTISEAINLKVKLGSSYDPQINSETIDYDGVSGSQSIPQFDGGGELKITALFLLKKRPEDIQSLKRIDYWYKNGITLTMVYADSEEYTNLIFGGNYLITDAALQEPRRGRIDVTLTLQKQKTFPSDTKTFTNWKPAAKKSSASTTGKKTSPLYDELSKCKLPRYIDHAGTNKSTQCDLVFQKLLRQFSFYITYKGHSLKLDGYFGIYTQDATKKFQKKYNVPVTGKLDTNTLKKLKALTTT